MTCREKLQIEHPENIKSGSDGGCEGCPDNYGYLGSPDYCCLADCADEMCTKCWDRVIPEETVSTKEIVTDGLKHDGGKPRLDLVPPEVIEAVGAVMTFGAKKYGENSYRNVEPKRYRAALMRHICKWLKEPYGKDEDSGLPHLWHIACNVAFLLELDSPLKGANKEEQ